MRTDVIWRMKQRLQLRRAYQLCFAGVSYEENSPEAYESVAGHFEYDMSCFRDEWTRFDHSKTPLIWRWGRIAIRYHFLSPARIVEVLSVMFDDRLMGSELNHIPDSAPLGVTPPAGAGVVPSLAADH